MSMHLETESRRAFELVASAADQIKSFQGERVLAKLEKAQDDLAQALVEDPGYVDAIYYSGMANDLAGKAEFAIPQFEQVREAKPSFLDQVEYNLGVAHYHRYNPGHLEKAIVHFNEAINATRDDVVRALARAGLAQTYGMKVRTGDLVEATRNFDLCKTASAKAEGELNALRGKEAL